jgi:hypothetical protein
MPANNADLLAELQAIRRHYAKLRLESQGVSRAIVEDPGATTADLEDLLAARGEEARAQLPEPPSAKDVAQQTRVSDA